MGSRSRRSREVELFNFSFLDILACVIGLLIFILSIVVVSGGGSASSQRAAKLSDAEHQLKQAKTAADLAAARRQRAEAILSRRARDFANPGAAADAVRSQIRAMDEEKAKLDYAAASAIARRESFDMTLSRMSGQPVADPSVDAVENETKQLDERTAALVARTAEEKRKAEANTQRVRYYTPHLREVHRNRTLWVEVSGDRVWCIESDDYGSLMVGAESTRFTRRADAAGTSVSAMVKGTAPVPSEIASAIPRDTVLMIALDADGYPAFRALRQWAWDKGFSVNWSPHDGNDIVLTRAAHVFEQ